ARLENIARFLDFISESITRAAEQAREVLHTTSGTTSEQTAQPSPDHG
ncbi:MarR family transcriptional regulator, partial [Streptomyces sp. NPDC001070]